MPRSFWYVPIRAGSTHWPSRWLFRAAKWLRPHCLFDMCFQSAGEVGGHRAAALERGVCLKARGESHLAAAFVHTPVWLQKASESTPSCQLPISAALSLHACLRTDRTDLPVLSPALTTGAPMFPFAYNAKKPWITAVCHNCQASVTSLLYYFKQCVSIHWREGGLCQIEASVTCSEALGVSVSAMGRQLRRCFQSAVLEFNTFPRVSAVKQYIASVPWPRVLVKSTV